MFFKPSAGSADLSQVTNVLGATHGGTGLTVFAINDMFMASSIVGVTRLATGTSGQFLKVSASLIPTWSPPPGILNFESSTFAITSSGTLLITHGLGSQPDLVSLKIINKTPEAGYTLGDQYVVDINQISNSGADTFGAGVYYRGITNISVVFGSNSAIFNGIHATTSAPLDFTNANWNLVVKAQRFT
jgi:hypothetical protein